LCATDSVLAAKKVACVSGPIRGTILKPNSPRSQGSILSRQASIPPSLAPHPRHPLACCLHISLPFSLPSLHPSTPPFLHASVQRQRELPPGRQEPLHPPRDGGRRRVPNGARQDRGLRRRVGPDERQRERQPLRRGGRGRRQLQVRGDIGTAYAKFQLYMRKEPP